MDRVDCDMLKCALANGNLKVDALANPSVLMVQPDARSNGYLNQKENWALKMVSEYSQTLRCWCYLPTFANVGLRRNIGVYKANVALRGIHPNARSTILLRLSHAKSRQITVLHECTPNLAYTWPKCMPNMAYIQSDNHAKSRSITPNHAQSWHPTNLESDKPNVAKLCLHTNVALRGYI